MTDSEFCRSTIGRCEITRGVLVAMRSLTLNRAVTQSRKTYQLVRCRSLAGSREFQYEAMINNQWQVVTHKIVKELWESLKRTHS